MNINVLTPITDYEGKAVKMKDGKDKPERDLTFRDVVNIALSNNLRDEIQTGEDKSKTFQIGLKLWKGKSVDFTVSELEFIRVRAEKILDALSYGRVVEIIEGPKAEAPPKA